MIGGFELQSSKCIKRFKVDSFLCRFRVGYFYKQNGSSVSDGVYTVHTGIDDLQLLGQMYSWNNATSLDFYGDQCNSFNESSVGDFQEPFGEKVRQSIKVFAGNACRWSKLHFAERTGFKGIPVNRYNYTDELFDYDLEENQCYCESKELCPKKGVYDSSKCSYGAPSAASLPHFLFADASFTEAVSGMQPDLAKHNSFVDMHPTFGVPLRSEARIQLNLVVKRDANVDFLKNLHSEEIYFPLLWFEAVSD